jgi:HPr kinase/phosphorylase
VTRMSHLFIKDLIEYESGRLDLAIVSGTAGLVRELKNISIQIFNHDRMLAKDLAIPSGILLMSQDDILWMADATAATRRNILNTILSANISSIILSNVSFVPEYLHQFAEKESIPLLTSEYDVFRLESRLIGMIREKIDHIVVINGVLVDVFGIGVVIVGESGIGKSECGLELVTRGHKLIADDVVEIEKKKEHSLSGRSTDLTKYFMEIRGLGVINVKSLFGVAAVSDESDLSIMVEFVRWEVGAQFNRIESKEQFRTIMGVSIPLIKVPVRSGGSMATIVEIVARNEILKRDNYRASFDLKERIFDKIREQKGE